MHGNPLLYVRNYIMTVADVGNISSYTAYHAQDIPSMIYIHQHPDYEKGDPQEWLNTFIPNALSVSLAGYSFFSPAHIGIFFSIHHTKNYTFERRKYVH